MKRFLTIAILAAVMTGLNALKPVHVDDATFYFNAAQIASYPLDPYGYVMMRWSDAVPALHALAPPGLPYWWAAAIHMFGDQPALWKIWLFPFVLTFVVSLDALLRRFAPSVAAPLLVSLVLSPVFLPSLNLMMDIPAQSLSALALVVFMRACDRRSPTLAVLSGLTAGLAMQTKYTAFLCPATVLVYASLHGRLRLGLMAALVAGSVFAAWESALFLRYGESHFVYQLLQGDNGEQPKQALLGSLFPLLGGAAPTLSLLALTVLLAPRWLLLLMTIAMVFPFLLLLWPNAFSFEERVYQLAPILFAFNGGFVLLSLAWGAWRLVSAASPPLGPDHAAQRAAWFLALWFVLELVGYVGISPFPAVRRIMGITIAGTLLIGYVAEQARLDPWRRNVLRGAVVLTMLLGLAFSAVDFLEARAEQLAATNAAEFIERAHPRSTVWYAGYWGFQYYAEKSGMKQIVPLRSSNDREPALMPPSHFHSGDWLIIPDDSIPQQELDLNRPELEMDGEIAAGDAIPLATLMNYYAGAPPLRHLRGPRIVVRLYRVKDDFIAR